MTATTFATTAPRTIIISDADRLRLQMLIDDYRKQGNESRENLDALDRELRAALSVPPSEVPADIVTMNSTVRLRIAGLRTPLTYTIVFPASADLGEGRISIFAPLATAVLGYRVGDTIEWDLPSGRKLITIDKLFYQPEAAGDYQH